MKQAWPSLSLITYNIHKGFGMGKIRFLLPKMRHALLELNPDFVFLQEVQGMHDRRAKRIQAWPDLPQFEYMAERDWPHYLYAKNAIYRAGHHGNAILSKYPFERFDNFNLSKRHSASRSILHAEVKGPEGSVLHLLCVHLGLFNSERQLQTQTLIRLIQELVPEDEPLLMAGDFNDWRLNLSEPLKKELGIHEVFQQLEGKHARSFPALKPTLRVDRVYFRGLSAKNAECLKEKPWRTLSDHLPLCAQFML